MNSSLRFLEKRASKIIESGDLKDRMKSTLVIIWCSMSKNEIIAAYFFENENVKGKHIQKNAPIFFISRNSILRAKHEIPA